MPFIALEGLDGAGKSTQLSLLTSFLDRKGVEHEYLHFPRFDTPIYGELIARFLRGEFGSVDEVNPYLVALIFAGDRADAAPMMKGWLETGKYILTDRFVYSNVAFQSAKYPVGPERYKLRDWIIDMEFGYNSLPRPDLSIFLDVPFDFTALRLASRRSGNDRGYLNGQRDIHEDSLELQRSVREVYLDCASRDPAMAVIDCSDGSGMMDTPENIFSRISALVEPLLK